MADRKTGDQPASRSPQRTPRTPWWRSTSTTATALWIAAVIATAAGIVTVFVSDSLVNLAYLTPLVGVLLAVAAAVQELDKRRYEREADREHDRLEAQRRFDERFAAATAGFSSDNDDLRATSAAELLFFLREQNQAFAHQTYYYLLNRLKAMKRATTAERVLVQAFDRAAHRVLAEASHPPEDRRTEAPGREPIPPQEMRMALDLSLARLDGVNLSRLELGEANISAASMAGADLSGTCLWRARANKAILHGSNFSHANLEEAQLVNIDGESTNFTSANLVAARFSPKGHHGRANLRRAQFVNARLQGACLTGAILTDARFDGANLRGASFRGATLNDTALTTIARSRNATWRKAHFDDKHKKSLERLDATYGGSRPPKGHPSDRPLPYYRRHPEPHHVHPHQAPPLPPDAYARR